MNPEWATPTSAAQQDFASQKRLLAQLISAMLDLSGRIADSESRAEERRLQSEFDNTKAITIALSSLLKAEGIGS